MNRLEMAVSQIRLARRFLNDLLRHIPDELWYRQPSEGVTNVAWQAGHLAVAQYGLALRRIRGERPEDEQLVPTAFRQRYGKGSTPNPDPAQNASPDELRSILARVHEAVLDEVIRLPDSALDESAGEPPHPVFSNKLGALLWCAQHELVHSGQVALLRRLFGAAPLR